jgi:outer membrane protein assembly factor BamB
MRPTRRAASAGVLALAAALCTTGSAGAAVRAPQADAPLLAAAPAATGSWLVYHQNLAGTGVAPSVTAVSTGTRAWTSPNLDGDIYGEPLVFAGRVYVATENDTVYALSSATGRVAWSRHLGRPVPAGSLPCGNIAPTVGITGTPVIDPSRSEIFVVADELVRGRPAHILAGLAAASGRIEMTRNVDPAGWNPAAMLQRTGLTLDAGRVVFGMGGNYGDCGSYRGRVEAVPEAGGALAVFSVDGGAGQSGGAVWMGGAAPIVDRKGNVWVTAGNGSATSPGQAYDHSDSVLELSSAMRLKQFFAPRTWPSDNAGDLDMSTAPALLADGQVVAAGKARVVYLLNGARLGGIGHQQAVLRSACGEDIDGGFTLAGMTVYLPCLGGVIAVRATRSPASLQLVWSSGTGGGPPIIAAGLVWTIGQNGTLYGLSPVTGRVRQQASVGSPANHFPTPSVGGGLLLAPAARNVVAFRASSRGATVPVTTGPASTTPASPASPVGQSSPTGGGGISPGAIAASVIGGLVVVGGGAWLVRRRRIARSRHVRLASRPVG